MAKVNLGESYNLYKRIFTTYMTGYWRKFAISLAAMAVAAATEPAFASLMKPLIDKGFTDQDKAAMILTPLAVMGIFMVRAIASYVNETTSTWLSGTIVEKMRIEMFRKLLRMPVEYFDNNNSGRMISRIVYDVTQITDAGFNVITVTVKDGLTIIGLLGLLFYTNWQLTLFCFFTLPFVLVLVRVLSKRLRKLNKNNQEQYGAMTQVVTEAVQGQKIVKLLDGIEYESERFSTSVALIKNNNVRQSATSSLNSGVSQFLVSVALSCILYFATTRSRANGFTAGDFISFITAMIMIMQPMKRITNVTQSLQRGLASAESVFAFLDEKEEHDTGTKQLAKVKGDIKIENLTFRYPSSEKDILAQINLEIKSGETVALVGSSGSGKTTLANLIPRFYSPEQGEIRLDGESLHEISLKSLRDQIALVSQEVVLFNDSVYNNISYGSNSQFTKDEVLNAAKLANALEFIEELPQGFETQIGENGTRLSGGQKQRLAIARAILKNAPILVLDEATSALDNQSEKLVQEALDRLMTSRTTLVIAHRLSTIQHADKIVVMEQGRIVEVGKHEELLAKNGVYSNLYHIQFQGAN
ncbi:MAG TPA: lipid A export permease/ATP-binding protein MsbA [Neisseriales bacterium]|jgi:subfamily B ATP-binding cassette protein MsbA|nr:lipid A export permease/ATP-binding protein MsbA [Neisseriales bacterium]